MNRQFGDLASPPGQETQPFLSAPLPPVEVERLLRAIDERLRIRRDAPPLEGVDARPRDFADDFARPWEVDPLAVLSSDGLRPFAAPYFDTARGSRALRLTKRLLNLPLRLFARPQSYFNDALRRTLGAWFAVLRASIDAQAVLEHEFAEQRHTVHALAATVDMLRQALLERGFSAGVHVALDRARVTYLHVASAPAPGVDIVARPDALPFAPGRVIEILTTVPHDSALPRDWHDALRPGGLLRLVGHGATTLAPVLIRAGFAPAPGAPDAEELSALRLW